jgi:hypothetical protein
MAIDKKHLSHVKAMICQGIKNETKDAIEAEYSITDQLNATGSALTAIKSEIKAMVDAGKAKQAAVNACNTFAELNAVVPDRDA